ncbi:hypothetical protein M422DRAFT_31855 [Sphaerobolus stellatus SS14]|uniref:Uncharacterized protein n=1 Tax=Sphaerobolus stellatus (strain SS14) TaxID=990650 RepID=A0A0C9UDX4_SPHS4|nr:hypothetical protein M422DRAFT_31855 [Sphaerobolus stellatus SS14]
MQEKAQDLKQELCNALLSTLNEIRQAHLRIDSGPDIERARGIIHFSDACDKRHVDASRLQVELKEGNTDKQIEIRKLFVQLKQAYDARQRLWDSFEARINEFRKHCSQPILLTCLSLAFCLSHYFELPVSHQQDVLGQLDDNMAYTISEQEKKLRAVLKENSNKDREKLLRGVLGRL